MTNRLIVFLCIFAVVNLPAIKADLESFPNHATISKDFAVINDGKKDSKQEMKKLSDHKDKDDLYDNILQTFNISKVKNPEFDGVKRSLDGNKKHGSISPLVYIINNHERKLNERHIDGHKTPQPITDNNSNTRGLVAEQKPSEVAKLNEASKENTSAHHKAKKAVPMIKDMPRILPLARGSGNVVGAHFVIPPQAVPQYMSSNPFAPIDQLMKMANMLMFKVGMDSISPYRTQTTQMSFTPNLLMSLRAPNSQNQLIDDNNRPNSDYVFNSIEGSPSSSGNNNNGHPQARSVFYGPPLIFKHPISVDEPKQLINLIENALGSVLANTDTTDDDEIDLTCPIHHEKKSVEGDGKCSGDETTGDDNSGGVIQVCSCRLIKKVKNNVKKQEK